MHTSEGQSDSNQLLIVQELKKWFPVRMRFLSSLFLKTREYTKAVDGISFEIFKGEIFGLVGESGCGKTTTGRLVVRLIEPTGGMIYFKGRNIFSLNKKEMKRLRSKMQIVFQDPYESLDSTMKVYDIIADPIKIQGMVKNKRELNEIVFEALESVGLLPIENFSSKYSYQLSGGQRQRVAIARALVLHPELIVADEPVSMLDVSLRADILDIIKRMQDQIKVSFLFITHDLSVARYLCDRVAVMYLGKIVEMGSAKNIVVRPKHPYTKALVSAVPVPDPTKKKNLISLEGALPDPSNTPMGCRFHPRCPSAMDICKKVEPKAVDIGKGHYVCCHLLN